MQPRTRGMTSSAMDRVPLPYRAANASHTTCGRAGKQAGRCEWAGVGAGGLLDGRREGAAGAGAGVGPIGAACPARRAGGQAPPRACADT